VGAYLLGSGAKSVGACWVLQVCSPAVLLYETVIPADVLGILLWGRKDTFTLCGSYAFGITEKGNSASFCTVV